MAEKRNKTANAESGSGRASGGSQNRRSGNSRKRKLSARRRKRQRELRRKIFMLAAGLVLLIFLLILAVPKITKNKKDSAAQNQEQAATTENLSVENLSQSAVTESESQAESEPSLQEEPIEQTIPDDSLLNEVQQEEPEQPQEEPQLLYNPADQVSDDRSNFAVQPGVPCGQDHNNGIKTVYLTLDDGPSSITPEVLDCLDRYGVKATFFVTAQNPEYFYLIREAYDRGHTIGLHTYTHNYEYIYSSPEAYFEDLDKIGQVVKDQIGYVPAFIRFPGGAANWISRDYCMGIMTYLTQEVNNRGYQYFDWNCSTGDGDNVTDINELIRLGTSCEYTNVILLGHDGDDKRSTLEALPGIIEHYLSLGYEFRGIDRDTFFCHGNVRN